MVKRFGEENREDSEGRNNTKLKELKLKEMNRALTCLNNEA